MVQLNIHLEEHFLTLVEFNTSDPAPEHAHARYGGEPSPLNHNKLLFVSFSSPSLPSLPLLVLQQLDGALLSLGASHNQIFMQPYGGELLIEIYCQGDASHWRTERSVNRVAAAGRWRRREDVKSTGSTAASGPDWAARLVSSAINPVYQAALTVSWLESFRITLHSGFT